MRIRFFYAGKLRRLLWILNLLIFCGVNIFVTVAVQNAVLPVIKSYAKSVATRQATKIIYNAVIKTLDSENTTYSDLYIIKRGDDGTIKSIEINTPYVNSLKAKTVSAVSDGLTDIKITDIALGNILRHVFFLGRGPKIPVKLNSFGFTSADIKSEFTEAGINQTRHSVSVIINTEVSVVLPYEIMSVNIETKVPVTETVIVGEVPKLYSSSSKH